MTTYNLNLFNRVSLIAAVSLNGYIGKEGQLPWHSPADLAFFRRVTLGKPVVMGRKTWESLKGPLKGRLNVVITRQADKFKLTNTHPLVYFTESLAEGLMMADLMHGAHNSDPELNEIMVIGGGDIYRQALPFAERIYLSEIQLIVEGDTRFPDLGEQWMRAATPVFTHTSSDPQDPSFKVWRYARSSRNTRKETDESFDSSFEGGSAELAPAPGLWGSLKSWFSKLRH